MRACAFDIDVGRYRSIDRYLPTSISNVRGGWPQLAKHNLLAFGHRLRYRRDRHGHLPPRVSILSLLLPLSSLSLDFLPVVFPMDTAFIQIHEINPAGSNSRFFFLSSRSLYINGCEGKST